MAVTKLVSFDNLSTYDRLIKEYLATEDAKSIHTVLLDTTNNQINFYKKENATSSDTPDYQVAYPDVSNLMSKVSSPTAGDFVTVTATGELVDAGATIAKSKITGLGTAADADIATTAIVESSTDTGLVSAQQVATFVASEISGITGAMHFVGVITRQTGETDAQAIARVVTNPESGDVVVMSDNAKEYIYDGTTWREVGDEGEYVKKTTTIAGVDLEDNITKAELLTALNVTDGADANVIEEVQVNGTALTPSSKAVNVTIAEGATNGTIAVNGTDVAVHGLGSAAYTASTAYDAAGTAQGLVDALTADDIVYEQGTGGAADKTVEDAIDDLYDAIGSGGSVDDKIAAAIADLDSNTNTITATSDSSLAVLTEVGITDGLISSTKTNTLGSAATHADTDFMASADYTIATSSDINGLFS